MLVIYGLNCVFHDSEILRNKCSEPISAHFLPKSDQNSILVFYSGTNVDFCVYFDGIYTITVITYYKMKNKEKIPNGHINNFS